MTKKIHFHSDCSFFAGCENMLAVLFNSQKLHQEYEVSFSFAYSAWLIWSAVPAKPLELLLLFLDVDAWMKTADGRSVNPTL